jgi:hypothetical protein
MDRKIKILLKHLFEIMSRKTFAERTLGLSNKFPITIEDDPKVLITQEVVSPATLLIQDIVNSVIETGSPPYSDTLFVDSGFSFQEPKKKERTFGASGLLFPKNCYIGIFPAAYQFCSEKALLTFLEGLETVDPYDVRDKVKGKFAGCPIGITGGYKLDEPGATYNVFWLDEKTRVYYDPREKKIIDVMPLIIVI